MTRITVEWVSHKKRQHSALADSQSRMPRGSGVWIIRTQRCGTAGSKYELSVRIARGSCLICRESGRDHLIMVSVSPAGNRIQGKCDDQADWTFSIGWRGYNPPQGGGFTYAVKGALPHEAPLYRSLTRNGRCLASIYICAESCRANLHGVLGSAAPKSLFLYPRCIVVLSAG